MASEGPNNPGSWDTHTPGLNNAAGIETSDNDYANVATTTHGETWNVYAYDFGFAIPSGATIDGFEVDVERKASHNGASNFVDDWSIRLTKVAGTGLGDNKKKADKWPTTDGVTTYGGPSDLWGTVWTPAQVNASGFGLRFDWEHNTDGTSVTAYIDHITITVYYTEASGGSASASILLSMIGTP